MKRSIFYRTESGNLNMREMAQDEPLPDGYELVATNEQTGGAGDWYSWGEHARATRDVMSRAYGEQWERDEDGNLIRGSVTIATGKKGES